MRVSLALSIGLSAALLSAAACGGGPPPPPPQPVVDSAAIRDSIARVEAARKAREDSIRRAREEEERIKRERARADSIEAVRRTTEMVKSVFAQRIHFDFDKADIKPEDQATLDMKLQILQANPNLQIKIVGHCDERGSDEYNITLGQRRAVAAKQYLVDRGIDESRITVESMGEEMPIAEGHNEEAWAQNRRDEFIITAGGEELRRP